MFGSLRNPHLLHRHLDKKNGECNTCAIFSESCNLAWGERSVSDSESSVMAFMPHTAAIGRYSYSGWTTKETVTKCHKVNGFTHIYCQSIARAFCVQTPSNWKKKVSVASWFKLWSPRATSAYLLFCTQPFQVQGPIDYNTPATNRKRLNEPKLQRDLARTIKQQATWSKSFNQKTKPSKRLQTMFNDACSRKPKNDTAWHDMQRCIRSPLFGGFSGPRFCIISLRQFLTSQYILIHQSRLLFQTPPQQCSLWHQSQLTSEAKDMATIQGFNLSGPGIEIPKSETNVHWIILVNPDGGGSSAFFLQPPVPTQTSRIENSRNQTCHRIHQITFWEHDWDLTHDWNILRLFIVQPTDCKRLCMVVQLSYQDLPCASDVERARANMPIGLASHHHSMLQSLVTFWVWA